MKFNGRYLLLQKSTIEYYTRPLLYKETCVNTRLQNISSLCVLPSLLHEYCNIFYTSIFSSQFFILFGIFFLIATIGFWQLGKTETAKAFITPTLVAGVLILAVGLGIFFTNKSRVGQVFELTTALENNFPVSRFD